MEKRKAAAFADNLFLIICVWLLCYLWTRYYVMNLLVCLIAATGIALCVIMLINTRRTKNRSLVKKQRKIDAIAEQFLFLGADFTLDFVFDALRKKLFGADEHSDDSCTKCESNNNTVPSACKLQKREGFVLCKKTAVFCLMLAHEIGLQLVIDCYVAAKKAHARRMILLTINGVDKQARANIAKLNDIKIDVFDKNKCYDFLGWTGCFPQILYGLHQKKPSIGAVFARALDKDRARNYFVISIVLLASSYFVAYSIYYIVAASVTFCLALISRLSLIKKLTSRKISK